MSTALNSLREAWITVTPDGGLANVAATEIGAKDWSRPQDAVVRLGDPNVLEVTAVEVDALDAVLRDPMPAGRRAALTSLRARMVVPTELHVVVRP